MSYADKIFKETCKDILENGTSTEGQKVRPVWEDGSPAYTIKKFGVVNEYDLQKEFPAITLRRIALKSAMDEILWIYQKKSNYIEDLNTSIWDSWSSPVTNNKEIVLIDKRKTVDYSETYNKPIKINKIIKHDKKIERDSRNCGKYFLLEKNSKKCKVQFINTGNIKTVTSGNYYKGQIFDEYYRGTYNIGYYGDYKKEELSNYFGEYLERWKETWRHIMKRCNPNLNKGTIYEGCTVSPYFQSCENFLTWVKENNHRGKDFLKIAQIDKDYYGTKNYSENTCCLLTPKENDSLTLERWFLYNDTYYFSKEDLIKQIERDTNESYINFKNDKRVGISSRFKKELDNLIEDNKIKIIFPKIEKDGKLIRFSLKDKHSIGTAYGFTISEKSMFKNQMIDQIDRVRWQLKNEPFSRRIMTDMYQYKNLATGHLEPCAYSMTYNVTDEKRADGKLTLNAILNQRSQDMLAANGWNVAQYALLLMMLAQEANMVPGKLIHVIADCHIYDKHVPLIKELITREEHPAPIVRLNSDVKNFYDFTTDDLIVENYEFGPQIKNIPIAV